MPFPLISTAAEAELKACQLKLEDTERVFKQAAIDAQKASDMTIAELAATVESLEIEQAASQERINNLVEKNSNQITIIQEADEKYRRLVNQDPDRTADQIDQLTKRVSYCQDRMQEATKAWEALNQAAQDQADSAGYCSEYDGLIEEVNDVLSRRGISEDFRLEPRTKEYVVTMTLTTRVTAANEVEAREMAESQIDDGNFDSSDISFCDVEEDE